MNLSIQKGNLLFSRTVNYTKTQICSLLHRQIDICNKILLDVIIADNQHFAQILNHITQKASIGWDPSFKSDLTKNLPPVISKQPYPSLDDLQAQNQIYMNLEPDSDDFNESASCDAQFNDFMHLQSLKSYHKETLNSELYNNYLIDSYKNISEYQDSQINSFEQFLIYGKDNPRNSMYKDANNLLDNNHTEFENRESETAEMSKKMSSIFDFKGVNTQSHCENITDSGFI